MSALSNRRVRSLASISVIFAALTPIAGTAETAPNLAKFDCTRPSDLKTVSGDRLATEGYRIAEKIRPGDVNLMMTKPGVTGLATCFMRPEARK